ncbi:MAG: Fic family protein [Thermodesulfovibrionales bacterium]
MSRYDTSSLPEAQFEPGSRGRVLRNRLGIRSKRVMNALERDEQVRAVEELSDLFDSDHRFTAADIRTIHKVWLGGIYDWAGNYRQVNVSKGNFHFAAAAQIPKLMAEFERKELSEFTPCRFASIKEVVEALAVVHTEMVLIHPFREGNGRAARLLSVLMGLQAGLPPLDFNGIAGRKKEDYIAAVQAGMVRDYQPMRAVFASVIRRTLRYRVPR